MAAAIAPEARARIAAAARACGTRLLVLFGSRARGEAGPASDWDFGYLADEGFAPEELLAELVGALAADRIDLVDLGRAGALLRFRAARDGVPLFECEPGSFERFQIEAATFWCDVEPVLRRAYDRLLAELGS